MVVRDLIKDSIPPLKHSDTVARALSWMEEFRSQHLPVVKGRTFVGLVSEVDLLSFHDQNEILGNYSLSLPRPFLTEDQHIYDALKFVTSNEFSIVPVLDKDQHYLGVVTITDLIESFAEIKSINAPGGIIVLEFNKREYSLSEVARIIEDNDAMILSSSLRSSDDNSEFLLTLKLNVVDLSRIQSAFERRNIKVVASYHQSEFGFDLSERYESLMHYLNI